MAKTTGKIWPYFQGLIIGIVGAASLFYLLNVSGLLVVSAGPEASIVNLLHWCYDNLGLSIIPFALTLLLYGIYLKRLGALLNADAPAPEDIGSTEEKVDLLMSVFFGVGVIWTAIGMRNALLASLGNMDAETAAQKGAFYILTQLVEGGILLALSTTIFGGIGGYLMRLFKSWTVGHRLSLYYERRDNEERMEVVDRLARIIHILEKRPPVKEAPRAKAAPARATEETNRHIEPPGETTPPGPPSGPPSGPEGAWPEAAGPEMEGQ
ncbi:MAG: hypothetical protein GY859_44630 [Desulfobacterales bacterium]|nr:hypothetical protein [Desulfobacterales bacterium]